MKSLWRRLIRYLARKEIDQAFEGGRLNFEMTSAPGVQLLMQQSYAKGETAGRQAMYDHIASVVGARMSGAQDYVTPEDLALAKKGWLH